ncbi:MAG: class I SAM-dependent methyltransferase [Alphaproteobacteria bacterium]
MSDSCTLCGSAALPAVYTPRGTARGLGVHVCAGCGLVQSLPRRATAPRRPASVSGGADWGNVRYGKAFRVADTMAALRATLDGRAPRRILDVGSNRGAFLAAARDAWPQAGLTAVEPDERVVADYAGMDGLTLHQRPVEEVPLPAAGFDLIHCSHTLEHLADPFAVLAALARALAPGGVAYLEVPNLDTIDRADLVEEWFIDKHLYHFSPATFAAGIARAGLAAPAGIAAGLHLAAVARPGPAAVAPSGDDPARTTARIAAYAARLTAAQTTLVRAAERIVGLAEGGRVAIWGAGRILDSLVRIGGLDPARLALVVDRHLVAHAESLHGVPLHAPAALADAAVDVVVIASREFAGEIAGEASAIVPHAQLIAFADLLEAPQKQRAGATMR